MRRAPADELMDLVQQVAGTNDGTAEELLCLIRDRARGGTAMRTRGYARALIRDALAGSTASASEFTDRCIAGLSQTYNHPPLGGAGCFAYEGASWYLDTPNPPVLTTGGPIVTRRYVFSNAGSGGARIVGLMGSVRDAVTGASVPNNLVSVQILLNGDKSLTSNGDVQNFVNMANLFSQTGAYFPFSRLCSSRDFIDVNFRPNMGVLANNVIAEFTFVMGPLPYLGEGSEAKRDMLLEHMRHSYGSPDELDGACREQLYAMWQERDRMPSGCLSYESPTRFLDTEDPTDPILLPPGETITRRIVFTGGAGLIIGMMGSALAENEGAIAMANNSNVSVQLAFNGGENVMVTGRVPAFTSYQSLFQASDFAIAGAWREPFVPIRRLVSANDFLDVTFRNNLPPAVPLNIIPTLTLAYGRLAQNAGERC